MCLFNREIQGMNCGHEECKNFYSLNKQMSMYGLSQSSSSNALKLPQTALSKTLTQPNSTVTQKSASNFNAPQEINVKRPINVLSESSGKDFEISPTTHKIIKTENEDKNEGSGQKTSSNIQGAQGKIPETNPFPQPSSALNAASEKNLLNNFLLNNYMLSSPQTGQNMKPDPSKINNNSNLLLSLLQNPQTNFNLNPQLQPKTSNPQTGLNPLALPQMFSQNLSTKPGLLNNLTTTNLPGGDSTFTNSQDANINALNVANLINDMKLKSENGITNDGFLREFQGRILGLLITQNKMLVDLKEKNDVLQDTLACLITEVNNIKNNTKQVAREKSSMGTSSSLASTQFMGTNSETVSVENLMTFLYGPNPDFQFQLILKSDLMLPLYRERNFKFTVILTDKNGNVVENSNRIPLTIGLYSSENPPKYIDANTAGNKILKGFIEKDLTNGTATFEKIQIKEVTSHFRNGWIFFVVYPKLTNSNQNNMLMGGSGLIINSQKIKPLILEKVVVKAKKAKEKEQEQASEINEGDEAQNLPNEENPNEESVN